MPESVKYPTACGIPNYQPVGSHRKVAGRSWETLDGFTETDPEWTDYQVQGSKGTLYRLGGKRLQAIIKLEGRRRSTVINKAIALGLKEIDEAGDDVELYVRGDTSQLKAFAKLVGFRFGAELSPEERARRSAQAKAMVAKRLADLKTPTFEGKSDLLPYQDTDPPTENQKSGSESPSE